MSRYAFFAVLLHSSLSAPAYARDYLLNMAICGESSSCKVCIGEIKGNLTVNASAKPETISSTLSTTGSVNEPLPNLSNALRSNSLVLLLSS